MNGELLISCSKHLSHDTCGPGPLETSQPELGQNSSPGGGADSQQGRATQIHKQGSKPVQIGSASIMWRTAECRINKVAATQK